LKKKFIATFLSMMLLFNSSGLMAGSISKAIASDKGMAATGFVYALSSAISNFVWSFDWTRVGYTNDQKGKIQEGGGLSASAENALLGFIFAIWAYEYKKNHPAPAQTNA